MNSNSGRWKSPVSVSVYAPGVGAARFLSSFFHFGVEHQSPLNLY